MLDQEQIATSNERVVLGKKKWLTSKEIQIICRGVILVEMMDVAKYGTRGGLFVVKTE